MRLYKFLIAVSLAWSCNATLAQSNAAYYKAQWTRIDSLIENAGLPLDALKLVQAVQQRATRERKKAELLRCLLYKIQIRESREEEAWLPNIRSLETIDVTGDPVLLSVRQHYLALLYEYYLNRIAPEEVLDAKEMTDADINKWTTSDFHRKIRTLYLSSLQNKTVLQKTTPENWNSLLVVNRTARRLRPTLYDILAANTLEYFKNVLTDPTQPMSSFSLSSEDYLKDAGTFCRIRMDTKDTNSALLRSARIYQELLAFHNKFKNAEAYGDIDLNRIQFVYTFSTAEKKDSLYVTALVNVMRTFGNGPIADEAGFLLADWHSANAYRPGASAKELLRKAVSICDEVIAREDSTGGRANCLALKETLTRKDIRFIAEKINLPKEPFRILVTYKNTEKIHFRIIPLQQNDALQLRNAYQEQEAFWRWWAQQPPLRAWTISLPQGNDMTEHKVEVKAEGLPIGAYMILASIDSNFATEGNELALQQIHISSIGWIQSGNDLYIVDRLSGLPKTNATVTLFEEAFRYETGKTEIVSQEKYLTDSNGRIQLDSPFTNYNEKRAEVIYGDDHLFLENNRVALYYNYPAPAIKRKTVSGSLYSDRSIYRPEQIVFFKGLITGKENEDDPLPETDFNTTVYLVDPNGIRIDSALMTTNSFGSYSGSFTLPRNNLTGVYSLWDNRSYAGMQIRVEAYKRPRFEVTFVKPSRAHRPGDSISIHGKAASFNGIAVSYAKVRYTIRRRQQPTIFYTDHFPSQWKRMRSNNAQLITSGNTLTDSEGKFQFDFKALALSSYLDQNDAVHLYDIYADITDIQGETQNGSWSIPVSRNPIRIEINAPETLEGDGLGNVKIFTRNLYDVHLACTLHVRLTKLETPISPVRERLWEAPDQFLYDKDEFKKWFPLDEYANETDPKGWAEQAEILRQTDTSQTSGNFNWNGKLPGPGFYRLQVESTGTAGERITAEGILKTEGKTASSPLYFASIQTDQKTLEPGDTLRYSIKSNIDSVWLLFAEGRTDTSRSTLEKSSLQSLEKELIIKETDRGGISLAAGFYLHNRFYSDRLRIKVPFSNKELTIHYTSFREKTLPGASELWKIRIKNNQHKPVVAEILSTLYDASLDQFTPHRWLKPSLWIKQPVEFPMVSDLFNHPLYPITGNFFKSKFPYIDKRYETLLPVAGRNTVGILEGRMPGMMVADAETSRSRESLDVLAKKKTVEEPISSREIQKSASESLIGDKRQDVSIRKDFKETAFFLPHSVTDSNGEATISFRIPDALTRWKWLTLAHTRDLSLGYDERIIVTTKPLMAQANPPRFFREGDRIDYPVKITNTTDKELTGQIQLLVIDPETGESLDGWFQNFFPNQYFTVPPQESVAASFSIEIPYRYNRPVIARVVARTDEYSDGEESILPVLSERIMITESKPIPFDGYKDVHLSWEKLKKADSSTSLNHHALTLEWTSNPFWYAVQNLPYLAMNPGESADQTFLRFYANSLSEWVLRQMPQVKEVIQKWTLQDSMQLSTPFERNESLTGTLLDETPWVMEARSARAMQNKMIGHFNNENVRNQLQATGEQLLNLQNSDGSFSWFSGGPPNIAITLQILTGIARLRHLHVIASENNETDQMMRKGLAYMDQWMGEYHKKPMLQDGGLPDRQIIHYLYLRSFLPAFPLADTLRKPFSFYYNNARKNWNRYNKMMQGMIAIICYRNRDTAEAGRIINSLRQNALFSDEMGMYWKEFNSPGVYWDEEPIRSHALLMDAFHEITKDASLENKMRTWLIRQKETQQWSTSAGTAEACRTLLRDPGILMKDATDLSVKFGTTVIRPKPIEAGTGFTRITIPGNRVSSTMAEVDIHLSDQIDTTAPTPWGALHWQYMEDLDKLTPVSGPLSIRKKLFIERTTDKGMVLEELTEGTTIHAGEKIIVQLEVRTERNLEFVHLKDMRAAALEPDHVISSYHWTKGAVYYQANKDASMHFYFDQLPKGTYLFTYSMHVQQKGYFQNGIANLQCLYAPVFNSHTSSLRFRVE